MRRTGGARQAAHRRRGAGGRRHGGARARRPVPPHLVARPRRRRGAAPGLSRRPHIRAAHRLGRPQPLPQGPEPALSRYTVGARKPLLEVFVIAVLLVAMRLTVDTSFAYLAIMALT